MGISDNIEVMTIQIVTEKIKISRTRLIELKLSVIIFDYFVSKHLDERSPVPGKTFVF